MVSMIGSILVGRFVDSLSICIQYIEINLECQEKR